MCRSFRKVSLNVLAAYCRNSCLVKHITPFKPPNILLESEYDTMPLVRGIQIKVISQWELKVHPEFPHPDDNASASPSEVECGSNAGEESPGERSIISDDGVDIFGRYASASVYIPSIPGKQQNLLRLLSTD